jgi:hypothetical protein
MFRGVDPLRGLVTPKHTPVSFLGSSSIGAGRWRPREGHISFSPVVVWVHVCREIISSGRSVSSGRRFVVRGRANVTSLPGRVGVISYPSGSLSHVDFVALLRKLQRRQC